MYNKSRLQPWRKGKGSYLELVVSASRSFAALERNDAIALAVSELAEFFPAVAAAKLEKAALIKEVRATFGVPPGIDAARPSAVSPWPNCFLAGDWTATGWPSTMESAARSGHLAAEAICNATGDPRSFLDADLKPTGLMRWMRAGNREQGSGNSLPLWPGTQPITQRNSGSTAKGAIRSRMEGGQQRASLFPVP